MKAYVGVTDRDWYDLLAGVPGLDEANFWQPSGRSVFRALEPGGLFLFKLHSPDNAIVGGGFFAHFSLLPVSLAWEAFGESNGARSLGEMRKRIEKYRRRREADAFEDYTIGCILLEQPFFFPPDRWVHVPPDWSRNIVRGKGYDLTEGTGKEMWEHVRAALAAGGESKAIPEPAIAEGTTSTGPRYGAPTLTMPRLGQGSFRVVVTDAYERRCAATGERVLPVLEAAHIKPFSLGGEHRVDNGLLLRRDLHTLFDRGYVTVTPQMHLEVSRRIREDWENGREYYKLQGQDVRVPGKADWQPSRELLNWHNKRVFLG